MTAEVLWITRKRPTLLTTQVFDFAAWHAHRARRRYVEHSVTTFRSHFFRDLLAPLAVLVGSAAAVGIYQMQLQVSPRLPCTSLVTFENTAAALQRRFPTHMGRPKWADPRTWLGCCRRPALSLQRGHLPLWLPDFAGVSDTPFQLTSFALSLMLGFRTNFSKCAGTLAAHQQP
jgi:putative membrane protein